MKIGTDAFALEAELHDFLNQVEASHWRIYNLQVKDKIYFHASLIHRHDIMRTYPLIKLLYTGGIIGMSLRGFFKIERMIAFITCLCSWFVLSHTIFEINILGDSPFHQEQITQELKNEALPFLLLDFEGFQEKLVNRLMPQFHWLEMNLKGSSIEIQYLGKKAIDTQELGFAGLVAKKEGVIALFDVKHGNKEVTLNQFVQKGDLLISSVIIDSMNQPKTTYVEGKVYAYTFLDLEVLVEPFSKNKAIQFFECLFEIRSQVSSLLHEDEKIVLEIPLQFEVKEDKIRMKNYYVLYEQIAVIGELDETK